MNKIKSFFYKIIALLLITGMLLPYVQPVQAQTVASPQTAKISFTFDDGLSTHGKYAAPILNSYGFKGTEYISTSCIGSVNTCAADPGESYMTWTQVKTLKNTYGWEIAAHARSHTPLTTLTDANKLKELTDSNQAFVNQGLTVKQFASPEGDYDYKLLSYVARYYASHRGFWDRNLSWMGWPYNDYVLQVKDVQAGVTVAQVKSYIDQAVANKQWLILVFHGIKPTPSSDPDEYEFSTTGLSQIASYAKSKQNAGLIRNVTIEQGLAIPYTNIIQNGNFSNGIPTGWTTDSSTTVVKDTNLNGSYPAAQESIAFKQATKASHLYTPFIPANPNASYAFKVYVNNLNLTSGVSGFYIDEYDNSGNWISGRWLGEVQPGVVTYFGKLYKPTSSNVASFKIQSYLSANAVGTAYIDNFQAYNIDGVQPSVTPAPSVTATPTATPTKTPSPTPSPTVTVTDTPTPTPSASPSANIVLNGSFENVVNGFASDWGKDNDSYTLDTDANGNDGTKSIKLTSNTTSAHLFSSVIPVDAAASYTWSQFIKVMSGTGEFGFYIDEFDGNGTWISGQWKGMINTTFSGIKTFSYTPSSAQVKAIRLQYYATPNSTFTLYLDSVSVTR